MLKFIRENKKLKTKNLYLGELKIYHEVWTGRSDISNCWCESFEVPRKIIVQKKGEYYVDIFTKTEYLKNGDCLANNDDIVICNLQPAWTTSSRIRYKDAENLFKEINSAYIKK